MTLPVQYRMASDIMALPNALIYDGALRCGNESVAATCLHIPAEGAAAIAASPSWIQQVRYHEFCVCFWLVSALNAGSPRLRRVGITPPATWGTHCLRCMHKQAINILWLLILVNFGHIIVSANDLRPGPGSFLPRRVPDHVFRRIKVSLATMSGSQ